MKIVDQETGKQIEGGFWNPARWSLSQPRFADATTS
jgi:hypothetical protein